MDTPKPNSTAPQGVAPQVAAKPATPVAAQAAAQPTQAAAQVTAPVQQAPVVAKPAAVAPAQITKPVAVSPVTAAATAAKPTQTAASAQTATTAKPATPTAAPVTQATKPTATAPTTTPASGKKFLLGCFGAFGCCLFLFIAVIFGFLAFGSTNNPIFGFFGVAPSEVYNVIFTLTNLIFLVLVFLTFIFVIVGIFKRITARKDDVAAKRSGNIFIFFSVLLLTFFIVSWVFAYFYLVGKRTVSAPINPIITTPTRTINLTAPITIKFDGTKALATRPDVSALSYEWDFGDGSKARGNTQTHTYTELGDFSVSLKIAAKNRQTAKEENIEFKQDVTIANVLANIVIKADPKEGPAPLSVTFDASDTTSDNGEITGYAWDLDGNGEFDDSTDTITSYTYEKIQKYTVGLRVTDSSGQTADSTIEINATAPDDPIPVIAIDGADLKNLVAGAAYVFSGTQSTSPKGTIENYSWEFSDGTTSKTRTVKHTFNETGEYDVTLKITDSAKKTAVKTVKVTVVTAAQAPVISMTGTPALSENNTITGDVPLTVELDASDSTDSDNAIVEYKWDFDGDGKTDDSNAKASFTYSKAGTYTAKLSVIDATEKVSEKTVTVIVTQKGLGVDVTATPTEGSSPLRVLFDASKSTYPEGKISSFEWDFGDGTKPRIDTAKITYQYTRIGSFTAKVTAITNDNKRASATISINVRPISLSACFDASIENGPAPLSVTFDSLCSKGTVIRYTWDFGGLKKSNERRPTYTFTKPGTYEVSLEVKDNLGIVDTFSKSIIVK